MENKKSKGIFSKLFSPKSDSHCCNIHFEEIIKEETATEGKKVDLFENSKEGRKEPGESKNKILPEVVDSVSFK